jgi:hypothetical protein
MRRGVAMSSAEYATRRAVGMICLVAGSESERSESERSESERSESELKG